MSKGNSSKAAVDNRANQLNPQHAAYHQARGTPEGDAVVIADQVRESNEAKSAESTESSTSGNSSTGAGK